MKGEALAETNKLTEPAKKKKKDSISCTPEKKKTKLSSIVRCWVRSEWKIAITFCKENG